MIFDLNEKNYDENKIEVIELNCPWTIAVPSGASHDFMITKLRWSFEHPFWLTASIYPIDNHTKPITLDNKRETLAFAKLFITLTLYKEHLELHFTQHEIHTLRELMDTAEFHMGYQTSYYLQEIKKIIQNQSNQKSSLLVVPDSVPYN